MTVFEAWRKGKLESSARTRLLKSTVIPYCKAYSIFLSYRNDEYGYAESVELAADACNTSVKTVERAIKLATKKWS